MYRLWGSVQHCYMGAIQQVHFKRSRSAGQRSRGECPPTAEIYALLNCCICRLAHYGPRNESLGTTGSTADGFAIATFSAVFNYSPACLYLDRNRMLLRIALGECLKWTAMMGVERDKAIIRHKDLQFISNVNLAH